MMPWASDRIANQQAVGQRRTIMRADRTDGEECAGLTHEQDSFAIDMARHHAAFGNIWKRNALSEIGPAR